MTKNIGLITLCLILGLLLGGIITYAAFPRTEIKEVEKVVQVPVEVVKQVNVSTLPDYKQEVADALMLEVSADKDLRTCDGVKFDIDEISIKKVYDGFKVVEDSDGDQTISNVKVKLNYDDGDCYNTLTCKLDAEKQIFC